jgi:stage II sporulation protein D
MRRPHHPATLAALAAGAALAVAGPAAAQTTPTAPPPPTTTTPAPPGPGPAPGDTTVFTFSGRGWGHGVGMSQYGARGRALAGWSARRILTHYYRGARLTTVRRRVVRVLLAENLRSIAVWSPDRWRAIGARPNGATRTPLRTNAVYRLFVQTDGRLALQREGRTIATFMGRARVQGKSAAGIVAWGPQQPEAARRYRGGLRAVPMGDGTFDLVNVVGLEDYLKGVVPREMPAGWGDDAFAALAAQAVAARSYALATLSPGDVFDMYDDDRSQVYGGVAGEDARSSLAVARTKGRVLTYHGQVITAFFFSTSGGRTEDVQNVFTGSGPRPYLVSVADPFDRLSPYHVWPDPPTFTAARLGRLLGLDGPVAEITVLSRGRSPRVRQVLATTLSGKQATLTGSRIRAALGLRDTWFSVSKQKVSAATAQRLVRG